MLFNVVICHIVTKHCPGIWHNAAHVNNVTHLDCDHHQTDTMTPGPGPAPPDTTATGNMWSCDLVRHPLYMLIR